MVFTEHFLCTSHYVKSYYVKSFMTTHGMWASLMICLDQQNATEVMLCQF